MIWAMSAVTGGLASVVVWFLFREVSYWLARLRGTYPESYYRERRAALLDPGGTLLRLSDQVGMALLGGAIGGIIGTSWALYGKDFNLFHSLSHIFSPGPPG